MSPSTKRYAAFGVGACVLLGVMMVGMLKLSRSRTYQVFGDIIPRVQTTERVLALTFDDGPTPEAVAVLLPILRSRDVKATFFAVGRQLEKFPDVGRWILWEGHELGNHSYSHQRMVFKSPSFIDQEIRRTDEIIRDMGYEGEIPFRPPYGKKLLGLPYYLSEHGRPTISWDVDPDAGPGTTASSAEIVRYVVARAQPGSIILLHPMYPSRKPSLEAVAGIIDGLKQRGYRFVTGDTSSGSTLSTLNRPKR